VIKANNIDFVLQDKIQQEQIDKLERRLENLTNTVYKMVQHMDTLNQKVSINNII